MEIHRKKILFLITKSNWGGAQRYIFDLATSLTPEKFDVVVAHGGTGEMATRLQAANIQTIPIKSLARDISFKKELSSFSEINQLISSERPDILHVNSSKAGGIGAFLGRVKKVPRVIYTAHGWAFNEDRSPISKFVAGFFHWLTVLFAHTTIAVSETTKAQLRWPFVQQKMIVIHNGRNTPDYFSKESARTYFIEKNPQLEACKNDIWIGTIGELHPVKRQDLVINALAKLNTKDLNARHIIIGTGEEESNLKQLVIKKNLNEHVFFLGHIHEAAQYLQAFDIFVLSSRSEALAYVVVEAAQAGLPIVATRVGGIPEIITSVEIGQLVEANDSDAFATALGELIKNPDKRKNLGHNAQIRGRHFSLDRMVSETMKLYKS